MGVAVAVDLQKVRLGDVQRGGDLQGPRFDEGVLAHVLGVEDAVLVLEAVGHVLQHLALARAELAGVQEVGDQLVRDPDLVVVGQGHEGVGYFNCVLDGGVSHVPGGLQEGLERWVEGGGVRTHQVVDYLEVDALLGLSDHELGTTPWDGHVFFKLGGGKAE